MAEYQADHVGFARLMKSDEVGRVVQREAEYLAAHLRATAPRDTGEYASKFYVESGLDILEQDRSASFVINDSRQATALEVGSWNIRNPSMPMTKALQGIQGVG